MDPDWLPQFFEYRAGRLWLEELDLEALAGEFGTPCYVYSAAAIRQAYRQYQAGFAGAGLNLQIRYAVKALSNLAVLRLLGQLGAGADVVSGGELYRALKAGIPAARIVFAGVGKTAAEIDYALSEGIEAFNVESAGELELIRRRVATTGAGTGPVGISIRVNPDVEAGTHPYITTGKHTNKFGLSIPEAGRLALAAAGSPELRLCGLQMHIGSQLLEIAPLVEAFRRLVELAGSVEDATGRPLDYLDVGGGLGASYTGQPRPQPAELARGLAGVLREKGKTYPLLSEPGRFMVAEAGALLTETLYLKQNEGVNFAIVDAGMNDLLRPALYQARHKIVRLAQPASPHQGEVRAWEVVGPVCESGDWLGQQVELPGLRPGDRLAILGAGAYAMSMASNYNSRPRPPEILVDGQEARLVRRRESWADLVQAETD